MARSGAISLFKVSFLIERTGTVCELLRDDRGQALFEYALVTAVFAIFMVALLSGIQSDAGNNINGTQAGLANESAGTP